MSEEVRRTLRPQWPPFISPRDPDERAKMTAEALAIADSRDYMKQKMDHLLEVCWETRDDVHSIKYERDRRWTLAQKVGAFVLLSGAQVGISLLIHALTGST